MPASTRMVRGAHNQTLNRMLASGAMTGASRSRINVASSARSNASIICSNARRAYYTEYRARAGAGVTPRCASLPCMPHCIILLPTLVTWRTLAAALSSRAASAPDIRRLLPILRLYRGHAILSSSSPFTCVSAARTLASHVLFIPAWRIASSIIL